MIRCICPECRPKGVTLRDAMRKLAWDAQVQRYGLKEAQRRKQAGIDRLRELRDR